MGFHRVDSESKSISKIIDRAIDTFEVKTASISRSGYMVQVRVLYELPEPNDGKQKLGYFSVSNQAPKKADFKLNPVEVLKDVIRFDKLVEDAGLYGEDVYDLKDGLNDSIKNINGDRFERLKKLADECKKKLIDAVKDGADVRVRRKANYEKAKDYLGKNLRYALSSGLDEDEIKEMLKVAIVENTMKS